ncbi:MAG: CHAT domain-containing protein [Cyanobacteria bacterium J06560_6]
MKQKMQFRWSHQIKQKLWAVLLAGSFCLALSVHSQSAAATYLQADLSFAQASPTRPSTLSWQSSLSAGVLAHNSGQFSAAIAHWQAALSSITKSHENALLRAYLLNNLAVTYERLGQFDMAQARLDESLAILQDWPTQTLTYWDVSARVLNTQGQMLWHQGHTQPALEAWQQAEMHYREAAADPGTDDANSIETRYWQDAPIEQAHSTGLVSSQINQALARQELGFNADALRQLTQLSQSIDSFPASLQLVTARAIGRALRQVGDFSAAKDVLLKGLEAAGTSPHLAAPSLLNSVQRTTLELGHTLRHNSHRARAIGKIAQADTYAAEALAYYESVIAGAEDHISNHASDRIDEDTSQSNLLQVQAQLNYLSYLIEIGQLDNARGFWPQISLTDLPKGRTSAELYISYAHSLICLQAPVSVACTRQEWQTNVNEQLNEQPNDQTNATLFAAGSVAGSAAESVANLWNPIGDWLVAAVEQARALSDPLLESYALGELGHAYELSGRWDEAILLTEQALLLVESQQLPEVAYRWEWQLGRIYSRRDRDTTASSVMRSPAMLAYQQAIASLETVRKSLRSIDPQVQFSFRDNVEPLYREYVALLLAQYASAPSGIADALPQPAEQTLLTSAVKTLDALQLTELENFLGCNLTRLVNLSESRIDPQAAKIYPIILPDQLAIIVDIPEQPLFFHSVLVSQSTVESTLADLRESLTLPGETPAVLVSASQLYDWLIAPLEPVLASNKQIETLVFVPDGPLRNIPMGVLYDGEQYLVEKSYAIATAPQLDLFAPHETSRSLKILRGGIGLSQTVRGQNFPAIELIQAELEQIPSALTVAPPLIDEAFTISNIEQQLASQQYSAIHWKTHGVFSSDPEETFLVAYQETITANELSEFVRSASAQRAEPIELLVLSACETAKGDRRAVLGLAGMAVRSGTRSVLSTLWRADDRANTALMDEFYQGLNEGLTKALALQRAQQILLAQKGYPAPYYWASYVLVGNWL